MANLRTNWGPGSWIETREDGVVKSLTVKIKGWRIINNEDGTPKTYSTIRQTRSVPGTDLRERLTALDRGGVAEIEETHTIDIPEEHQTDKVYYLNEYHEHDHTQGDAGDIEYQEKTKEWVKLLKEDSDFLAKEESVLEQLIALGEE